MVFLDLLAAFSCEGYLTAAGYLDSMADRKSGDDAALEFSAQTWTHDYQGATVGFPSGVSTTPRSKRFKMVCFLGHFVWCDMSQARL